MTVLEWLKGKSRYSFEETIYQGIAIDREINDTADVATLTVRDKELFMADIIFTATILSPSSTSSQSASHNNFQRTIGGETDIYQTKKLNWAKAIYKLYNDPRYDELNSIVQPIKQLPIEDII